MDVDRTVRYIDGTKIEANANKYSFVYKIRITKARKRLYEKITEALILLNKEKEFEFPYHFIYCAQEIGYIAQNLMACMIKLGIDFVYGKGKINQYMFTSYAKKQRSFL